MRAFFITLVVLLVVGCGVAYWLHWWRISKAPPNDNGETEVRLTMDKDKMNKDVNAAKGTIKDDVEKLKERAHEKGEAQPQAKELLVEGTIRAIDPSKHTLTVTNDKKEEVAVRTDADTRIRVGDKEGTLADLKIGDAATVTYESAKGEKAAKSVTVKKRS
jgi:hypothetical protein